MRTRCHRVLGHPWSHRGGRSTALISEALDSPNPNILPGTRFALRRTFTGLRSPVDYILGMLVLFWWETIDGSHPATSTIGLYVKELSPGSIFLPPVGPGPQALTPGDGVRGFLLWDQVAGYSTVLVVVLLEFRSAFAASRGFRGNKASTLSAWIIGAVGVGLSLVLGPGCACLIGSWTRDEIFSLGIGEALISRRASSSIGFLRTYFGMSVRDPRPV
ncbi:hypothetical protein P170DRAFT_475386 [Aspergillus steynii IBT 23096]|uniref:Uncharacterized protein n=1 Tax=Aspergillus steynii IBT 23096 TaxID=1392250 RepID=A0A2I2G844_9EURO|nr:uncharacterized protein P170DRAFT_475386 [Aspergillus steynii IBT 23096]PLB49060.1 hypothetical protein P170DRAFT_475386 [Aspergillus steynii IBT 23096]